MCHPAWGSARAAAQRLSDLARLRRVRDRIDREYTQPLDVEALARDVNMSAGHLSRQFRLAYGESPYAYLMTRRIERATALFAVATSASPRSAPQSSLMPDNATYTAPGLAGAMVTVELVRA
jgi:methylphosphotriester-DNA--protein-cysteine methyltransferase